MTREFAFDNTEVERVHDRVCRQISGAWAVKRMLGELREAGLITETDAETFRRKMCRAIGDMSDVRHRLRRLRG